MHSKRPKFTPPKLANFATRRGFLPPIFDRIQYLLTPKISRSKFNSYPFGATWILRGRSSFIRFVRKKYTFSSVGRTLNYWHRGWNYLVSPWNFSFLKILPYKRPVFYPADLNVWPWRVYTIKLYDFFLKYGNILQKYTRTFYFMCFTRRMSAWEGCWARMVPLSASSRNVDRMIVSSMPL